MKPLFEGIGQVENIRGGHTGGGVLAEETDRDLRGKSQGVEGSRIDRSGGRGQAVEAIHGDQRSKSFPGPSRG